MGQNVAKERLIGCGYGVIMCAVVMLITECRAYTLLKGPQPHRVREFYVNPFTCGEEFYKDLMPAVEMWNFYGARLKYRGGTAIPWELPEGFDVVLCEDLEDRGKDWGTMGSTYYWWDENGVITDSDIIFDTGWMYPGSGTYVHEFGHLLGLGHTDAEGSAMKPGAHDVDYLVADDIAGLAELYGIPANCTPWAADDLTVYFPYVNGHWVELKAVDVENGEYRFILSDAGRSPESAWECDLVLTTNKVVTSVYYAGRTFYARLVKDGEEWVLKSANAAD